MHPEHNQARALIDAALDTLNYQNRLITGAIDQLNDAQLHQPIAPGTNNIAVIVRHLRGNIRSRWTDFLTTDGEKASRDRETEFSDDGATKPEVLARWNEAYTLMSRTIGALTAEDLARTVTIRGQPHTVPRAICRALDHTGYHIGQVVLIAKALAGQRWSHLTVPPGQSAAFNASLGYNPAKRA